MRFATVAKLASELHARLESMDARDNRATRYRAILYEALYHVDRGALDDSAWFRLTGWAGERRNSWNAQGRN